MEKNENLTSCGEQYERDAQAWQEEWEFAYSKGQEYFKMFVKPFASNVIDEETFLNGFVAGWFQKQR